MLPIWASPVNKRTSFYCRCLKTHDAAQLLWHDVSVGTYNANKTTSILLVLVRTHALSLDVAGAAMDYEAGLHLDCRR
jgi:hypothetical protein